MGTRLDQTKADLEALQHHDVGTSVTFVSESHAVMISPWQRNRAFVPQSR